VLNAKRIAVVIPAFREAKLIRRTLTTLPNFVDAVYVVDDASDDGTAREARAVADPRVSVLCHEQNRGVGAAIVTGYRAAFAAQADVTAVMGGDAQMDPTELAKVVEPVLAGRADYVKGNRFLSNQRHCMPWQRRTAGKCLSLATRWATGLDVDDCQCGYTAISWQALRILPLDDLWPRFGYPNDLLLLAAECRLRVEEVVVRPIYGGEQSGVRPWHALLILGLILRRLLASNQRSAPGYDESARSTIRSA